jgi:hypothetical protein
MICPTALVSALTISRIEIVIGATTPIRKESIFIAREPASSFSNKNEKKYRKAGLVNIITANNSSTPGTSSPNKWTPIMANNDGID